jgi:AcrR family transcriptional regulator
VTAAEKPAEGEHPRRGRRRSTHSHEAVLAATIAVLRDVGYTALTLEAVAATAGVGKATIYRWWPSKASLVIEALDTTVPITHVVSTDNTRTDIRAIVAATVQDYLRTPLGPNLAAIITDTAADPHATQRLAALLGSRRAAHASVLLAAAGRGDLPHDIDVHLMLDIITGTLIHRALLGITPDEHTIDELTDLLTAGAPPRTTPRNQP